MKGTHTLLLSLVGIGAFIGLAGAFYKVFPGFADGAATSTIAAITIGAAVALLFFGVMLGIYHGTISQRHRLDADLKRKFINALSFERKDRARLDKELHKTQKIVVNLEDQLSHLTSQTHEHQQLSSSAVEEKQHLREEIEQLKKSFEKQQLELEKRKDRLADLMTELSTVRTEAEQSKEGFEQMKREAASAKAQTAKIQKQVERLKSTSGSFVPHSSMELHGESAGKILEGIAGLEGVMVALVADDHGMIVEYSGEGIPPEALAAVSAVIGDIGAKVNDVLPLDDVNTITIEDNEGLVLETRFFELLGSRCAFAVARDAAHSYPGLSQQATKLIHNHFEK